MSVTNQLVFWWESLAGTNSDPIDRVMSLFASEAVWCCRERVLPSTPIRMQDGRAVVDEMEEERSEEPGIGFSYHFDRTKTQVLEIAKRSQMIDVSFASGQRGAALFAEQQTLPAERFNKAFSANPTLSLGPHDIWEWSMEEGDPPPVLYYGRAAVSLSLNGYGSPDMHPPEFCELLVNLPEMKKLRAELDAIFGASRAVYMVNS